MTYRHPGIFFGIILLSLHVQVFFLFCLISVVGGCVSEEQPLLCSSLDSPFTLTAAVLGPEPDKGARSGKNVVVVCHFLLFMSHMHFFSVAC